jgi:hypothetical protein
VSEAEPEDESLSRVQQLVAVRDMCLAALAIMNRPLRRKSIIEANLIGLHELMDEALEDVAELDASKVGEPPPASRGLTFPRR